ncbi:hypothetical protein LINPERHAP1_LOCUS34 [Linum perenne]
MADSPICLPRSGVAMERDSEEVFRSENLNLGRQGEDGEENGRRRWGRRIRSLGNRERKERRTISDDGEGFC